MQRMKESGKRKKRGMDDVLALSQGMSGIQVTEGNEDGESHAKRHVTRGEDARGAKQGRTEVCKIECKVHRQTRRSKQGL